MLHRDTRRDGREAEGAPLLREYGLKRSIEGSNPSLSAIPLTDSIQQRRVLVGPRARRSTVDPDLRNQACLVATMKNCLPNRCHATGTFRYSWTSNGWIGRWPCVV